MVTVFVVQTGLWVASGIFPASAFAAGGSLVPAVALARRAGGGRIGRIDLRRIGGAQAAAKAMSRIQQYFFMGGIMFASEKCAFVPVNASRVSNM